VSRRNGVIENKMPRGPRFSLYKEGQKFNDLTLVKFSHVRDHHQYWEAKCDCSKVGIFCVTRIKSGHKCQNAESRIFVNDR
jgi:hypothetical protein